MPTGLGKTYSVAKFIAENYNKIKGKIFFVTQLKKNLPEDDLRKCFSEIGKQSELDRLLLRVENNVDNLCLHFEEVKDDLYRCIQDKYFLQKIEREIKIINHKDSYDEDEWLLVQQAKDDLNDVSEKKLRDMVYTYLSYDSEGKQRNLKEKRRLVKEDQAYTWIGKLYPTVNMDEKKILIMSLDKFMLRFSTIIEPSFNLYESNYIKEGVVFIDEFDSTKDVILRRIIQNGLSNEIGIINLFRTIYSGLFDTEFTKILTEQAAVYRDKKYKSAQEIIERFQFMAKAIVDDFNLKFFHKLKNISQTDVGFLFQDHRIHTIVNGKEKKISVEKDEEKNINWLAVENVSGDDADKGIYPLINEINNFLRYFQRGISYIADNYYEMRKERKQEIYNISRESSIRTTLAEFGIYGSYQNYLTYNILVSKKKENFGYSVYDALDGSVYEKGFRYYQIIDNDNHDTQSRVNYVSFNDSPEKFLIRLIERTKVVGISASAHLPSVLSNYDMDYIRKEHNDLIFEIPQEDIERLNDRFNKSIENYHEIKIKCYAVGDDNKLSKAAKELFNDLCKKANLKDYLKERFLCFAQTVELFFNNKNVRSFLYFSNSKNSKLEIDGENLFMTFFAQMNFLYSEKAEFCFLSGANETFERRKQRMFESLKNGKKVFAVTSYWSMGAGQNVHYEFNSEYDRDLVKVNSFEYNSSHKDFDAIYLETPSNILVNAVKGFDSEEEFIKYIYQLKFLQEVGEINTTKVEERIKDAFLLKNGSVRKKHPLPNDSSHFDMAYAKVAMQAIGRICRTRNKQKTVYILYQKSFAVRIKPIIPYFSDKLTNPEFREFLASCDKETDNNLLMNSDAVLINKAIKHYEQTNELFNNLMANWSINNIEKWESIREAVLKHPTVEALSETVFPDLYIELPQESNCYYHRRSNRTHEFSFRVPNGAGWQCLNEQSVMLDRVLKIPYVNDYFVKAGYATRFKQGKYMLGCSVLNRIYRGALGEVVGRFLLTKNILKFLDLEFESLPPNIYEKFDNKCEDVFFDFKLWSGDRNPAFEQEITKIRKKMYACQARKVIYVNILKSSTRETKTYLDALNDPILVIPYLYDDERKEWNREGIHRLFEELLKL